MVRHLLCFVLAATLQAAWFAVATAADPLDGLPASSAITPGGTSSPKAVVSAVAFSPNGQLLASGGDDHVARIWNLTDGRVVHELRGHEGWIRTVAFSPDGAELATAGDDRRVRLWSVETGKILRVFDEHGLAIFNVQFSPDGNNLVAAGFENKLRVYERSSGTAIKVFDCPCRDMRALAFSPDGSRLAGGGRNGRIRVWNMADGSTEVQWQAHSQRIRAMCFSPDGLQLASTGEDRTIKFWNLSAKGQAPELFSLQSRGAKVMSLVYCGADKIATGGSDNLVRIWDLYRRQEIAQLAGHTGSVGALAATPGGQLLVSGSFDTSIRLWNVERHLQSGSTALRPEGSEVR